MRPLVSLITVTYNLPDDSLARLKATLSAAPVEDVEIIVIDNASSTPPILPPSVRLIQNNANAGFGAACNQGAEAATAPILFFLNPDCSFDPEMWEQTTAAAKLIACNQVDVIQPLVIRTDTHTVDTMGERLFWGGGVIKLGEALSLHAAQKAAPAYQARYFDRLRAGPSGAAFLIRKNLFQSIGGFCADYFLLHEDTDLALRLVHAKVRTCLRPSLVIRHEVSRTVNTLGPMKTYLAVRNQLWTVFRNFSALELILSAPLLALQSLLLLGYHTLIKRQGRAALKGLFDGLRGGLHWGYKAPRFWSFSYRSLENPLAPWTRKLRLVFTS